MESYKEAIQVGAEKLGRLRGKLGTLGRATVGRLLVMVLGRKKQYNAGNTIQRDGRRRAKEGTSFSKWGGTHNKKACLCLWKALPDWLPRLLLETSVKGLGNGRLHEINVADDQGDEKLLQVLVELSVAQKC